MPGRCCPSPRALLGFTAGCLRRGGELGSGGSVAFPRARRDTRWHLPCRHIRAITDPRQGLSAPNLRSLMALSLLLVAQDGVPHQSFVCSVPCMPQLSTPEVCSLLLERICKPG